MQAALGAEHMTTHSRRVEGRLVEGEQPLGGILVGSDVVLAGLTGSVPLLNSPGQNASFKAERALKLLDGIAALDHARVDHLLETGAPIAQVKRHAVDVGVVIGNNRCLAADDLTEVVVKHKLLVLGVEDAVRLAVGLSHLDGGGVAQAGRTG